MGRVHAIGRADEPALLRGGIQRSHKVTRLTTENTGRLRLCQFYSEVYHLSYTGDRQYLGMRAHGVNLLTFPRPEI